MDLITIIPVILLTLFVYELARANALEKKFAFGNILKNFFKLEPAKLLIILQIPLVYSLTSVLNLSQVLLVTICFGFFYLAVYDFFANLIPLVPTIGLLIITVCYFALNFSYANLIAAVVFTAALFLLWLFTKKRGLGEGDLFASAITGLVLGPKLTVVAIYIAIFSALLYSIVLIIKYKKIRGVPVPLFPFLYIGTFVSLLFGEIIWRFFLPYY